MAAIVTITHSRPHFADVVFGFFQEYPLVVVNQRSARTKDRSRLSRVFAAGGRCGINRAVVNVTV